MKLTTNSALVKIWARNIQNGNHTRDEVPDLFNLQEMVFAVLDAEQVN